jgi:hypothetical protein
MDSDIPVGKVLLCVVLIGSFGNIAIWIFRLHHRRFYKYSKVRS